jgi:hypothetical protein
MSPLISARRAAEDFARVVDGIQVDDAERFHDLTATVDQLRAQEIPVARAEFVADLRTRLMAAADTILVPVEKPARPTNVVTLSPSIRRHNRRLAVAAAAFVVVGGTAGVAAAAESALPGSPLYPIKRGIESAQVSLNSSDAAKGHDLISQAGTRLDEIDGLMNDGDSTSQVTHTLSSFKRSATSGADLLFVAYQRDGNVDDLAKLRGTFSEQLSRLQDLARLAPPTAQPDFASATALLADLDQQARVLCSNCGPDTGATDLFNLSSAPALTSLLTEPAAAAVADQQAAAAQALADKAAQIAASTPKTQQPTTASGSTTRDGAAPGVTAPTLPTQNPTVKSTVTSVTGGVEGLLDQVSASTGGVLTPVTDTVNATLDALTGLLLGN